MNLRDLGIKIRGNRWRLDINGPTESGNYVARIFRGDVLLAAGIDRDLPMAVQDALDDAAAAGSRSQGADVPVERHTCKGCGEAMDYRPGCGRPRLWCRAAECQRKRRKQDSDAHMARMSKKRERSAAE